MSQDEDPYAVSSDSEDEKGPPPKIAIERETDISQIKESLAQDEHKPVKDERTLEEIEELRKTKAAAVKRDFEEGKVSTAEGAQKAKEEVHGLDRSTLGQFKDKFENMSDTLQQNMAEKMQAGATKDELEEIKSQVNEVKQKWRTGDLEGADIQEDSATRDELEALKGVNVKERFQPGQGEFQKSYNRSELDTSGAADARKSFLEGSAFVGREVASAAAGELSELKFGALNAYKDKFEKGLNDAEDIERAKVELDLQLKELRKTFEKPESEMSPEERAEKKKAEIEAEFARYKLARKLRVKQQQESGGAGDEAAAAQALLNDETVAASANSAEAILLSMLSAEDDFRRRATAALASCSQLFAERDNSNNNHQQQQLPSVKAVRLENDDDDNDFSSADYLPTVTTGAAVANEKPTSWSSPCPEHQVVQQQHQQQQQQLLNSAGTARQTRRSAATASRRHRRRCRRDGGGRIRREESDEQIPQHRPDAEGAGQQIGRVGGVAGGGQEPDQEVRAGQPGLGGGERGQAASAGSGVRAVEGGQASGTPGVRAGDGHRGSARWRKGGNSGGSRSRVQNGGKMGEDPRQGGQEGGEVEDAGRQGHQLKRVVPSPSSSSAVEGANAVLFDDDDPMDHRHHSTDYYLSPTTTNLSSSSPNSHPSPCCTSSSSSTKMLLIVIVILTILMLLMVGLLFLLHHNKKRE